MSANTATKPVTNFDILKNLYFGKVFKQVKLTPTSKLVLFAIAEHFNHNNEDMYPSQEYLAEHLDIGLSSVKRAIKQLTNAGLIVYITQKVNRYKFTPKFFNQLNLTPEPVQSDTKPSGQNGTQTNKSKYINNPNSKNKISDLEEKRIRNELQDKRIRESKEFLENETKKSDPIPDEFLRLKSQLRKGLMAKNKYGKEVYFPTETGYPFSVI